mgnify:CR=1 FL=1
MVRGGEIIFTLESLAEIRKSAIESDGTVAFLIMALRAIWIMCEHEGPANGFTIIPAGHLPTFLLEEGYF